jgi:sugar lactone lactonase YvrE
MRRQWEDTMAEERANLLTGGLSALLSRRSLGGAAAAALTTLGLAATTDAKKKKKKKKKKPASCTPRSEAQTCAGGKCGSVSNNCGQQVDCGACTGYVPDKKIGVFGVGQVQFADPSGIAVDAAGNIYVADTNNNRIQKLSNDGAYIDHWGGSALGLNGPEGVAVDSVGNIYIADTNNDRVVKLDSDGTFVTEWNTAQDEEDEFFLPKGIAVDPSGAIWLSDWGSQRVLKFTSAGVFQEQIGEPGNPLLYFPEKLASNGTLYVADNGNNRIQRFPGGPLGEEVLQSPRGVALDADGAIYVVDSGNSRVQKFDSSGAFDVAIVESQAADGNFGLLADVAVDSAGNVFVLDETRDCIHKFRPAGAAPRRGAAQAREGNETPGRGRRRKEKRRRR